jgi:hypothetical protein
MCPNSNFWGVNVPNLKLRGVMWTCFYLVVLSASFALSLPRHVLLLCLSQLQKGGRPRGARGGILKMGTWTGFSAAATLQ